ncbi:hypothetical protein HHK36_026349 [Tetracentron sinense]|uniref:Uncharacterized protein n=1 Tax=Tetracentron sinense TaxID=13715 RepID=A0A834YGP0_TETSI|nr:hypothetical protein HHK36_026349 [Tetracentron sinense]
MMLQLLMKALKNMFLRKLLWWTLRKKVLTKNPSVKIMMKKSLMKKLLMKKLFMKTPSVEIPMRVLTSQFLRCKSQLLLLHPFQQKTFISGWNLPLNLFLNALAQGRRLEDLATRITVFEGEIRYLKDTVQKLLERTVAEETIANETLAAMHNIENFVNSITQTRTVYGTNGRSELLSNAPTEGATCEHTPAVEHDDHKNPHRVEKRKRRTG